MASFTIRVATGDVEKAGTDADVFLRCSGRAGKTPGGESWWELDNGGDDRERNQLDIYSVDGDDVGDILSIEINFQSSDFPRNDWYLEFVTVERSPDLWYKFHHNDWLRASQILTLRNPETLVKMRVLTDEEVRLSASACQSSAAP